MLPKPTSKNPLTLPKALIPAVKRTEYFDVTAENGRIALTPVRVNRAFREQGTQACGIVEVRAPRRS